MLKSSAIKIITYIRFNDIVIIPDQESEQQTYLSNNSSDNLSDEDSEQSNDGFSLDNNNCNSNKPDHSWILIWAFKYQERFQLPKVGINLLIFFLKLLLSHLDRKRFENFPSNINKARKLLKIKIKNKKFTTCPDYNKLYNIDTIPKNTDNNNLEFKCTHIEFPNYPLRFKREPCRLELLVKIPIGD
ncbi:3589_t:CDS:2, partial [Dentiscutata erythropus]